MGSSAPQPPSPEFIAGFRAAGGGPDPVPFDRFMRTALYDPRAGYYRRGVPRIGRLSGTDFFTASSSGPLFGRLVAEACAALLPGRDPGNFEFVEIGAEPGGGVLAGAAHPFRSARAIRLGEPILLSGPCVVFSNELFDAQPFRRFVLRAGAWRETGVALDGDRLVELELPGPGALPPGLPASAPEGYRIDAPLEAAELMRTIAGLPWTGLLVAFDYGKTWREISEETPAGTARAYHAHRLSADLLSNPGGQDLTCHVCWDWLAQAARDCGFAEPKVEFQESFLVRHASREIARVVASSAGRPTPEKAAVMQLIHPAYMGQKFQVMWTSRG